MKPWRGGQYWVFVGLGLLVLVRLGNNAPANVWAQVAFLFAGIVVSLGVALRLRDRWTYGFARGLIGTVSALMIGLPTVQLIYHHTPITLGVLGTYALMASIWIAPWIALRSPAT